jgi:hypothetical protein
MPKNGQASGIAGVARNTMRGGAKQREIILLNGAAA